jgi:uncharacterized protein YaiL (DUF2058 family)
VLKRLKLLRRLQEVDLESPEAALALLERVKTHTSSAEDRERLAHLIRVTLEVTDHIQAEPDKQTPLASERLSVKQKAKRTRQIAKAARRRHRRSR